MASAAAVVLIGSLPGGSLASARVARSSAAGAAVEPAAASTLVELSGRGTATTDGVNADGEWDRAGIYSMAVALPVADGGGTADVVIQAMNDDTNLYVAAWISTVPGCSFYPSFMFDSDGDGGVDDLYSDHISGHANSWSEGDIEYHDAFMYPANNISSDTMSGEGYPPAGTIDGTAGASHQLGTTTFAEFAHPLDSPDDQHDFSRSIGQSIRMVVNISVLGGSCGTCQATTCFAATIAPALGQFVVSLVPEDDEPPVMIGLPRIAGAVPSTLGDGSTLISWAGEDPGGTGIDRYVVERRRNGGAWRFVAATSETELRASLRVGDRYRYRVTPRDKAGNYGSPAVGPAFTPDLVQDGSPRVRYEGRWRRLTVAAASGGTVRSTFRGGERAWIDFTGYSVSWVTSTGPDRGRVAVFIDGVRSRVIDLRTDNVRWRRIRFSATWMEGGHHRIKLKNLDHGGRLDVDAFVVYR